MRSILALVVVLLLSSIAFAGEPDPKACDKGDGRACLDLGLKYINGDGVAKDPAKGLALYLKACDRKVAEGCGFAATMTLAGEGTPKSDKKGHALRDKACTLKHAPSCNDLGAAWAEGDAGTGKKDLAKAKTFYEKACSLDDGIGCFNYGNMFRLGMAEKVDLKRAMQLFQKACDLKAAGGCTELAIIYYEGTAVPRDVAKATELLEMGCKLGSEVACKNAELLRKANAKQ